MLVVVGRARDRSRKLEVCHSDISIAIGSLFCLWLSPQAVVLVVVLVLVYVVSSK